MKKYLPVIAGLGCALIVAGIVGGIITSRPEPQSTNNYQNYPPANSYQSNDYPSALQQQDTQWQEQCEQSELHETREKEREYSKLYDAWLDLQRQIESLQFEIQMLQIDLNGVYQEKAACIEAHANDEPTGTWLDSSACIGYDGTIASVKGQISLKQGKVDRLRCQADEIKFEMEKLNY